MNLDKIKERIKRLAAMADDTTSPNEAAIAARRLRKLLDEHNLQLAECLEDMTLDDFIASTANTTYRVEPRWASWLSVEIAKAFDCQVDYYHTFKDGQIATQYKGYAPDVEAATWLYDWLVKQVNLLAKLALARADKSDWNFSARRFGSSFRLGASVTICKRLKEFYAKPTADGDRQALVLSHKQAMTVRKFGDQTWGSGSSNPVVRDGDGYAAGKRAGQTVSIARTVSRDEGRYLT